MKCMVSDRVGFYMHYTYMHYMPAPERRAAAHDRHVHAAAHLSVESAEGDGIFGPRNRGTRRDSCKTR